MKSGRQGGEFNLCRALPNALLRFYTIEAAITGTLAGRTGGYKRYWSGEYNSRTCTGIRGNSLYGLGSW